MSTRLRAIYVHAGQACVGRAMRENLEYLHHAAGNARITHGTLPEAKRLLMLYEGIPKERRGLLFMFREPRRISFARSRFKQLCRHFGIAGRKPKKILGRATNGTRPTRARTVASTLARLRQSMATPAQPREEPFVSWTTTATPQVSTTTVGGSIPGAIGPDDQWRFSWDTISMQPRATAPEVTVTELSAQARQRFEQQRAEQSERERRERAERAAREFAW